MKFTIQIESTAHQDQVFLSGAIDENSNFTPIKLTGAPQLVIDLKDIKYFNSMGLRNWVSWTRSLNDFKGGIVLRNCPNVVVHQMSILEGFLPLNAVVESLEVPYLCDDCGHMMPYLALRGRDYHEATRDDPAKITVPEKLPCDRCGYWAEPDIIPNKHFKFLSRRKPSV